MSLLCIHTYMCMCIEDLYKEVEVLWDTLYKFIDNNWKTFPITKKK